MITALDTPAIKQALALRLFHNNPLLIAQRTK
jgi:hypothetical protein